MSEKPEIGSEEWIAARKRHDKKAGQVADHLYQETERGEIQWEVQIVPDPRGVCHECRTTYRGHKLLLEVLDADVYKIVTLRFSDPEKTYFSKIPALEQLASLIVRTGGDNRDIDRVLDEILGLNLSFVMCGSEQA